jgi:hypothetical protein
MLNLFKNNAEPCYCHSDFFALRQNLGNEPSDIEEGDLQGY